MCEKCEQQESEAIETPENDSNESQEIELTSLLDNLVVEDAPININELLETEMVLSRTLYLSEEITLETVNHIIMLIHKWNRDDSLLDEDEIIPIVIYFDSFGGEAYRGFSLLSAIKSSQIPVIGILMGSCMSMCLPLWLSCDFRYASRYSNVMYHTLRAASDVETLNEMTNKIKHYKQLQKQMDTVILQNTKIPKKKLKKKRDSNLDWFITFDEMTKYEMYDAVID